MVRRIHLRIDCDVGQCPNREHKRDGALPRTPAHTTPRRTVRAVGTPESLAEPFRFAVVPFDFKSGRCSNLIRAHGGVIPLDGGASVTAGRSTTRRHRVVVGQRPAIRVLQSPDLGPLDQERRENTADAEHGHRRYRMPRFVSDQTDARSCKRYVCRGDRSWQRLRAVLMFG
jgi:hypothetical protein